MMQCATKCCLVLAMMLLAVDVQSRSTPPESIRQLSDEAPGSDESVEMIHDDWDEVLENSLKMIDATPLPRHSVAERSADSPAIPAAKTAESLLSNMKSFLSGVLAVVKALLQSVFQLVENIVATYYLSILQLAKDRLLAVFIPFVNAIAQNPLFMKIVHEYSSVDWRSAGTTLFNYIAIMSQNVENNAI